jgi:hypothetical protein
MFVDKEKLLEPEIEKSHACLSPDSMNEDHISEDLHFMIEESQGIQDYIESWFRRVIGSQCSILQYLLISSQSRQLVSHILGTYQRVYFKPAYEFIYHPITDMVPLEVFIYLKSLSTQQTQTIIL